MDLVSKGIITNRKKGFNEGKLVASSAIGTSYLYEFLDDNPAIEFHPSDYVNDPVIISCHHRMVSMDMATAIDLTGQVAADTLSYDYFSGVSGMLDFIRGAARSKGGKSILMLPVDLEETVEIEGKPITIRPAKPVDERRIQEHFYNQEKSDIISRFFHEKTRFVRDEVENISQIDYIRDLTLVAVIGEVGFEKIVAVGEYLLNQAKNMAEVAFSVNREFQNKGLGRLLLKKLFEAARENGISGLIAYTSPQNQVMVRLFKSLPYKCRTLFDGDVLTLSCKFDELK